MQHGLTECIWSVELLLQSCMKTVASDLNEVWCGSAYASCLRPSGHPTPSLIQNPKTSTAPLRERSKVGNYSCKTPTKSRKKAPFEHLFFSFQSMSDLSVFNIKLEPKVFVVDGWKNEILWGPPSLKCSFICIPPPLTCHKDQWNWMWACEPDNAGQSPFISIRQQGL